MSFISGISAINKRPDIAPANKIGEGIAAARKARHEAILKVLDKQVRITIDELAVKLNFPTSLMRNDVAILINKGELKDSWDSKQRYIRRSIL